MSTTTADFVRACSRCSHELPPETLVCDVCHTLTHSEKLEAIAAGAKALEASGDLTRAREQWLQALPLLPSDSKQAGWIRDHERELERAALTAAAHAPENGWARKLAPLGPIAIVLAKGKSLLALFKFQFLFSLVAFMGVYWRLYGAQFGIGLAVLVLVHELGHFIDIKRRGLPADMPVFLPGLGAYVRWQALGVSARTRAAVSLAGPMAGWIASAVCAAIWWKTGVGVWAALARATAWLNIMNLIPIWALDGGQAANAVSKAGRFVLLVASLGLWLLLGENVFLFVAAGAAYRLFTKDVPVQASYATTTYFLTTLTLLGITMWLMPGQGFGK